MPSLFRVLQSKPSKTMESGEPFLQIPPQQPFEEETSPCYDAIKFYPAKLYEILNNRYELVAKLGWGATSTVWLAKDLKNSQSLFRWRRRPTRFVAIKITKQDFQTPYTTKGSANELEMTRTIANANSKDPGRMFVSTILDSFETSSPFGGMHMCMAFEPLCEPLWLLQQRFHENVIPLRFMKLLCVMILEGLRFLHEECRIIHTDLKSDNIMMSLRDVSVLEDLANAESISPTPRKLLWDRTIYMSRYGYASKTKYLGRPMITDFGLAVRGDGPLLYHAIQPNEYRAPEVILGAEWNYAVDIWNLGALLWDLTTGAGPFDLPENSDPAKFSSARHMARMISILGYPRSDMLRRGRATSRYFDKKGTFRYLDVLRSYGGPGDGIARHFPPLHNETEEDREMFIAFLSRMLKWRPEDRSNAANLLEDPFLKISMGTPNGKEALKGKERKPRSWLSTEKI